MSSFSICDSFDSNKFLDEFFSGLSFEVMDRQYTVYSGIMSKECASCGIKSPTMFAIDFHARTHPDQKWEHVYTAICSECIGHVTKNHRMMLEIAFQIGRNKVEDDEASVWN